MELSYTRSTSDVLLGNASSAFTAHLLSHGFRQDYYMSKLSRTLLPVRFDIVALMYLARLLDWRFGADLDDMKLAFTMQFFPGQDETVVEWENKGRKWK